MARLVFECQDSEGNRVFFQTSEKEGAELIASYTFAKRWLLDNGFTPLKARSTKPRSQSRAKVRFDGQHCPQCGGAIWDNHQKKQDDSSKAKWPDYSCRDREGCHWAVWPGQYEMVQDTA